MYYFMVVVWQLLSDAFLAFRDVFIFKRSLKETPVFYCDPNARNGAIIQACRSSLTSYTPPWYGSRGFLHTAMLEIIHHISFINTRDTSPSAWINREPTPNDTIILVFVMGLRQEDLPCYLAHWKSKIGNDIPMYVLFRDGNTHAEVHKIHTMVCVLRTLYKHASLVAVGYSSGGNHLLKYLEAYPGSHGLKGAVNVGCGNDLVAVHAHFKANRLIDVICGMALGDCMLTHHDRRVALQLGYVKVEDYYRAMSSHRAFGAARDVMILNVMARDDPALPASTEHLLITAALANEHVITVITDRGGHVAWLQEIKSGSWVVGLVLEWIRALENKNCIPLS